tara:strand:- start:400 stop:600 length:201 start_codon:yes stop_codon:yes gene_type:complete
MAKFFILIGIIFILVGLLYPYLASLGLGKLPGDIVIEKKNFNFYFPITTSIILSILLSLLFKIFFK